MNKKQEEIISEEQEKSKPFELSDLFTRERINSGVWYEPRVESLSLGLRFCITGASSPDNLIAYQDYLFGVNEIKGEKTIASFISKKTSLDANMAAKLVIDMQTVNGEEITVNGIKLTDVKDALKKLFEENNALAVDVIDFATKESNFMNI